MPNGLLANPFDRKNRMQLDAASRSADLKVVQIKEPDPSHADDTSPSALDWDAAADEINALSSDVTALEQKIDILWDYQPAALTPVEPTPEATP